MSSCKCIPTRSCRLAPLPEFDNSRLRVAGEAVGMKAISRRLRTMPRVLVLDAGATQPCVRDPAIAEDDSPRNTKKIS